MNVYNKIKDYISFPFVYEDNFAWSFMKNSPPKVKITIKMFKKKKEKNYETNLCNGYMLYSWLKNSHWTL